MSWHIFSLRPYVLGMGVEESRILSNYAFGITPEFLDAWCAYWYNDDIHDIAFWRAATDADAIVFPDSHGGSDY